MRSANAVPSGEWNSSASSPILMRVSAVKPGLWTGCFAGHAACAAGDARNGIGQLTDRETAGDAERRSRARADAQSRSDRFPFVPPCGLVAAIVHVIDGAVGRAARRTRRSPCDREPAAGQSECDEGQRVGRCTGDKAATRRSGGAPCREGAWAHRDEARSCRRRCAPALPARASAEMLASVGSRLFLGAAVGQGACRRSRLPLQ